MRTSATETGEAATGRETQRQRKTKNRDGQTEIGGRTDESVGESNEIETGRQGKKSANSRLQQENR